MDNSYFIFTSKATPLAISRFHVCSWEYKDDNALMEFGFEINASQCASADKCFLEIYIPWLKAAGEPLDLFENLKDPSNSKFVFNDSVLNTDYLPEGEKISGVIHNFYGRGKVCFLPVKFKKDLDKRLLEVEVDLYSFKNIEPEKPNIYIRFCLEIGIDSISTRKTGISRSTIIYDIKINEKRNLPHHLSENLRSRDLCKIATCFCFNIVPNDHELTFLDNASLKSVRTLEYDAFSKYLGNKKVKDGNLVVVFNKKSKEESYSFFSIFTKERIGAGQFALAVLVNILTGIMLYLPSLREKSPGQILSPEFAKVIPGEVYIAVAMAISTLVYFVWPSLISAKATLAKLLR